MRVRGKNVGVVDAQLQDLPKVEVTPRMKVREHPLDHGEISLLVYGPPLRGVIRPVLKICATKRVRFAQVRSDVFALCRGACLIPRALECVARKNLDIQAVRIGRRGDI